MLQADASCSPQPTHLQLLPVKATKRTDPGYPPSQSRGAENHPLSKGTKSGGKTSQHSCFSQKHLWVKETWLTVTGIRAFYSILLHYTLQFTEILSSTHCFRAKALVLGHILGGRAVLVSVLKFLCSPFSCSFLSNDRAATPTGTSPSPLLSVQKSCCFPSSCTIPGTFQKSHKGSVTL